MSEYLLRHDDEGDVIPCCNCDYECPTVETKIEEFAKISSDDMDKVCLCEICYCTFLSWPTMYPKMYSQEKKLWGGLAWIGNRILDEIRKPKEPS